MSRKKSKIRYTSDLPGKMYLFFISYSDRGAPSFLKFARTIGITTLDLERFRSHSKFDQAYRECQEIRRDYLIDHALDKRFDGGFTKYLLSAFDEQGEKEETKDLIFSLEVTE